jgi:ATP-binding cassette subfamily B multidrug efflux pump
VRWRDVWTHVSSYRAAIVRGVALLVATNALDKTIPWLLRGAVDGLMVVDTGVVQQYALAVGACALLMALSRTYSRTTLFNVGRDVENDLRNAVLGRLHRLGPSFFQRMATGEVMSRAINDLTQVRLMVGFGMLNLVNSVLAYALALAFMGSMSWELTLWALLPYPLLVIVSEWMGRAIYVKSRDAQEALGALSAQVQETLSGVRIVRAFAAEAERAARFEGAAQHTLERNMSLMVMRGFLWPLLLGIGSLATLLVLWRGSILVRDGSLTMGQLVAFLAYVESLRWPTMGLGYILAVVQRGRASYARVAQILEAEPDVVQTPEARAPEGKGALRVAGLSFEYAGKRVLDDVSLEVPARGSLAIVGRTGSGKSTLAALLPRLLPTPAGTVFLDGDDVTALQLSPLRQTVGYAQQEPFLFSDTIYRNIGYGLDDPYAPGASERIRQAASEACILTEIEELPNGFDTVVGERGVQLSGGQKQRIALARALLNEPRVLVMDDPLSAVDARTEAAILDTLERTGRERTVVLITNRTAAAARCQQVVVLDAGRVVERGDHASLLAQGGLYASIARRQQLEQELTAL